MSDLQTIFAQLQPLKAAELRAVIAEAKRLLARKPLYIREIGKPTAYGRHIYLYATWNENGKTQQKSLGRKREQPTTEEAAVGQDPIDSELAQDGVYPKKSEATAAGQETINSEFAHYGVYTRESIAFLRAMLAEGFYLAN